MRGTRLAFEDATVCNASHCAAAPIFLPSKKDRKPHGCPHLHTSRRRRPKKRRREGRASMQYVSTTVPCASFDRKVLFPEVPLRGRLLVGRRPGWPRADAGSTVRVLRGSVPRDQPEAQVLQRVVSLETLGRHRWATSHGSTCPLSPLSQPTGVAVASPFLLR